MVPRVGEVDIWVGMVLPSPLTIQSQIKVIIFLERLNFAEMNKGFLLNRMYGHMTGERLDVQKIRVRRNSSSFLETESRSLLEGSSYAASRFSSSRLY